MSRAVIIALTGLLAAIAATALAWSAAAALQQEEPEVRRGQSVTICHATGNGKYVQNSPDVDSIVSGQGHGGHSEDIIPPFTYDPKGDESGSYPGQNWDRGGGDLGQRLRGARSARCTRAAGLQPGKRLGDQGSVHAARDRPDDRGGLPAEQVGRIQSRPFGVGTVVSSGSVASGSSGSFGPLTVWDGANAFPGDHEYRIEVSGPSCTKSDTSRYRTIENPPAPLQLEVRKVVVGSNRPPSEFSFTIGGETFPFESDGSNLITRHAGPFEVTEAPVVGFTTTYAGCTGVIAAPQPPVPVCTITNAQHSTAAAPPGAQGRGRLHEASE